MSSRHDHEHRGSFADGQAAKEHHPEKAPQGDFAAGQDKETPTHEGTFAEGQARDAHHPEDDPRGSYA